MEYCNFAIELTDDVLIALMQNHAMDSLNEHPQHNRFDETVTSCFDALIDACIHALFDALLF
jgi:hypothetical protein